MSLKYSHSNTIREHHGKPVYCVTFNTYDPENQDLLASVGGHQATVYRCLPNGGIEVVQVYVDDHDRPVNVESTANLEEFFCCKWSVDKATGDPMLLLAGKLALIRVINCATHKAVATLKGHGKEVNDICVHSLHPHIILTASKDHSIRLWNISTACCVLIMRGPGAHVGEVFTLDLHPWDPHLFVSGAMDGSVKVWSLKEHWASITASEQWAESPSQRAFPVRLLAHPIFSSRLVHDNYVDCCRWVGELLLSKSIDCKIKLWRPVYPENRLLETGSKFELLRVFEYTDTGSMWWVRFSTDSFGRVLACGNTQGNTYVWDLASPKPHRGHILRHKKCDRAVRQTAVSMDGDIIVSSTEDGHLWRWDRQQQQQQPPTSSKRNSVEGATSAAAAAAAAAAAGVGAASKRRMRSHNLQRSDPHLQEAWDSGRGSSSSGSSEEESGAEAAVAATATAIGAASVSKEHATNPQQQPQVNLKVAAEDAGNAAAAAAAAGACQNTPVNGSHTAQGTSAAATRKKPRMAATATAGGSAAAAAGAGNEGGSRDITVYNKAAAQTETTATQQQLAELLGEGSPAGATATKTATEPAAAAAAAAAADEAAEQLAELSTGQGNGTHEGRRRKGSRTSEENFTPAAGGVGHDESTGAGVEPTAAAAAAAAAAGNADHADTAATNGGGAHGPAAAAVASSSGDGRAPEAAATADKVVAAAEAGNLAAAAAAAVSTEVPEATAPATAADPGAADVESDDVIISSSTEGTPAGDSYDVIIID